MAWRSYHQQHRARAWHPVSAAGDTGLCRQEHTRGARLLADWLTCPACLAGGGVCAPPQRPIAGADVATAAHDRLPCGVLEKGEQLGTQTVFNQETQQDTTIQHPFLQMYWQHSGVSAPQPPARPWLCACICILLTSATPGCHAAGWNIALMCSCCARLCCSCCRISCATWRSGCMPTRRASQAASDPQQ